MALTVTSTGLTAAGADVSRILNLTPHSLRLVLDHDSIEMPTDGRAARLQLVPDIPDGTVGTDGWTVPVVRTAATHTITDLPAPHPGTLLVVARPVAEALPDRDDLAYPHQAVRDSQGRVIGCRALGRPSTTPSARPQPPNSSPRSRRRSPWPFLGARTAGLTPE